MQPISLRYADEVAIDIPPERFEALEAIDYPLRDILFEDDHFLIIVNPLSRFDP